jgi:hypothetical protein
VRAQHDTARTTRRALGTTGHAPLSIQTQGSWNCRRCKIQTSRPWAAACGSTEAASSQTAAATVPLGARDGWSIGRNSPWLRRTPLKAHHCRQRR